MRMNSTHASILRSRFAPTLLILVSTVLVGAGAVALTPAPQRRQSEVPNPAVAAIDPHQAAAVGGSPCASAGGFYFNAASFDNHRSQLGLVQTASWAFTPHSVPPSTGRVLNDPLNINTHSGNANDPWTAPGGGGGGGGGNLWPAPLSNVLFSSNMTPNGALTPRGANGLTFGSAGFFGTHAALAPTVAGDSLSIVCESPSSGKVQAMAIELAGSGTFRVRVVPGSGGTAQTETNVNVPSGQKVFVAFIKSRINRVDIWNSAGHESIASIALYRRPTPDCGDGNGVVNIDDLLAVIGQWGQTGTPCDRGGNGIDIDDLLAVINAWGPVQDTECLDEAPSNGSCNANETCGLGTCDNTQCTPSACICVPANGSGGPGVWICTDDCCGHCI